MRRLAPWAVAALLALAPAAQAAEFTFKTDTLIEIDFLMAEPSARAEGVGAAAYYGQTGDLIKKHGGEIAGVFEVYNVTNGMVRPQSIGLVQWPDAAAFKAFRAEADKQGLGLRTQVWRNFYHLAAEAEDTAITFDRARVYEFVTLALNPLGREKMRTFAQTVMPLAARDYSRGLLLELTPAAAPPSDLRSTSAHIVEWRDQKIIESWMATVAQYGDKVRDLLDPALDRRELIWTRLTGTP